LRAGNVSPVSNTANGQTLTAADGQPPTAPSSLAPMEPQQHYKPFWPASYWNVGVTGYTILQNGTSIGTTTGAPYFLNVIDFTQYHLAFTVTQKRCGRQMFRQQANNANVTTLTARMAQPQRHQVVWRPMEPQQTLQTFLGAASTDNGGVTGYTIIAKRTI